MRCSADLRQRVIDFVINGGRKAEAARRFQVSRGSVYNWTSAEDGLSYKKSGPKGPRSLDLEALRYHVETHDNLTQSERARHFGVSRHCIWYNLKRIGITRKKTIRLQGTKQYKKESVPSSSGTLCSSREKLRLCWWKRLRPLHNPALWLLPKRTACSWSGFRKEASSYVPDCCTYRAVFCRTVFVSGDMQCCNF